MSLPELVQKRIWSPKVKEDYRKDPRTLEDKAILSVVYEGKEKVCVLVECPDLQNQNNISCIPAGRYKVIIHNSASLKYKVFYLQSVTGRTYIYWHVSNTVFHYKTLVRSLKGCGGVGKDFAFFKHKESDKDIPAVTSSKDTLEMLMARYPDGFWLTIVDET